MSEIFNEIYSSLIGKECCSIRNSLEKEHEEYRTTFHRRAGKLPLTGLSDGSDSGTWGMSSNGTKKRNSLPLLNNIIKQHY